MDLSNLMQMANQLREQLTQAQSKAGEQLVTTEAGGGMVRVVMNGRHELVELKIDAAAAKDLHLLEDLVRAAVNQASARVGEALKNQMGDVAQSMGVDLTPFGLGDKDPDSGK